MLPDISPIGIFLTYFISYFSLFTSLYLLFIFIENKQNFTSLKTKRLPKVSILVPVYNGAKYVKECLNSLSELDYPKEKLEIIVLDDGSTDNSLKEAKKFKFKFYKRPHSGKANTINYGIDKTSGEIVGILDIDSIVEKQVLKKMVGYFNNKNVAAIHSGIRVKNASSLLEKFQDIEYAFSLFFKKLFSFVDGLFVTPGVFSLYKKDILKQIGKFDSHNVTEDLEIALRILSKGYSIKCVTEAKTYTTVPNKFSELSRQRARWNFGLIVNLKKYSFLLSLKYKELGYFILPVTILLPIILLVFFSYIFIDLSFSLINKFHLFLLAGTEPFLENLFKFHFSIGFLQSEIFFYSLVTLSLGLIFLRYLKKYALFGKVNYKIMSYYIIYLFTSGCIYFYLWIITIYKILRKDIRW